MAVMLKMCNMIPVKYCTVKCGEWEMNGSRGLSYKLTVEVDDEYEWYPCTKDVYEFCKSLEKDTQIMIVGNYSKAYKNFRITDVKVQN